MISFILIYILANVIATAFLASIVCVQIMNRDFLRYGLLIGHLWLILILPAVVLSFILVNLFFFVVWIISWHVWTISLFPEKKEEVRNGR